MRLRFNGGCGEVGRSCVELSSTNRLLLDCGVKLGDPVEFPLLSRPAGVDYIVVTHPHLDHSAYVPIAFLKGCRARVLSTKPTRDLCQLLWTDYVKVGKERGGAEFGGNEISAALRSFDLLRYRERKECGEFSVRLFNSGHLLGSSMAWVECEGKRVLYTGDICFRDSKLLHRADTDVGDLDVLIIESTYGSREDKLPSFREAGRKLARVVKETVEKKGKVLIPVFGVGRGQEVMLILEDYIRSGFFPKVDVFVDGMVNKSSKIYRQNVMFMRDEIPTRILVSDDDPFKNPIFRVPRTRNRREVFESDSVVVVASSGMLTGGPSVRYLAEFIKDPRNTIVLVGYQVEGTLGRSLLDGEEEIELFGEKMPVLARVENVHLSAHADYQQLVEFLEELRPPENVFVMHGERDKSEELADTIVSRWGVEAVVPENGDEYRF